MFTVIKYFQDLQDNNYDYHVGDKYPREGFEVSEERIAELSSPNNLQNTPLIEEVEKAAKKKSGGKKASE